MTMINCSKATYLKALSSVWTRGTREERAQLREPTRSGILEHGVFNYTEYGRQIDLTTWLMILRADMRGKLAMSRLLEQEFETTAEGKRCRKKPSPEKMAQALSKQKEIITKVMNLCPEFFAGMIEDDVHELREAAAQ